MLAPSDLNLRARIGDETVATTPDDDQPDYTPNGPPPFNGVSGHHQFRSFPVSTDGQLVAGEVSTIDAGYAPDFWMVEIPNIANCTVEVTMGPSDSTTPDCRLGPGGYCRLPGRGPMVTLKSIGSAACFPVVRACSGWGPMSTGDFEVYPGSGTATK